MFTQQNCNKTCKQAEKSLSNSDEAVMTQQCGNVNAVILKQYTDVPKGKQSGGDNDAITQQQKCDKAMTLVMDNL